MILPVLLAIDVGNTNIKLGAMEDQVVRDLAQLETRVVSELDRKWPKAFDVTFENILVCSVCPKVEPVLIPWLEGHYGKRPLLLGTDITVPIRVACDQPRRVGQDRLAAALAAYRMTRKTTIVVGVGTAITFDVIDRDGTYMGGAIGTGLGMAARALHEFTALLPLIEVKRPLAAIGPNTAQAIRSGIYWGTIGAVEELIKEIKTELSEEPVVLGTGGQIGVIADECKSIQKVVPHLALIGIAASYQSWVSNTTTGEAGQPGTNGGNRKR